MMRKVESWEKGDIEWTWKISLGDTSGIKESNCNSNKVAEIGPSGNRSVVVGHGILRVGEEMAVVNKDKKMRVKD